MVQQLLSAQGASAYWYNGYIVSSEIARGLDVLELQPSASSWPTSFVLARAYLDQLQRTNGLAQEKVSAARETLARAEQLTGPPRRDALTQLANALDADAPGRPIRPRCECSRRQSGISPTPGDLAWRRALFTVELREEESW